ncbi:MAG: hypothetical protein EZS28_018769 [Streblomastix strix]|uniref:Tyr recombinase domain-containing protein n=1 Tax=Streblomastix strix TaxID=222440 RepID=A0A5J4VSW2_9EUKA|nr:MAG: hypothetical protein EZS28_018769 [Streblomastix strix]
MSVEQLTRIDKPFKIIAEYITDVTKDQLDAIAIQARTSVSTMFELMGKEEKDIRNKVIEQLMLKHISNTRKVIREVIIWKMEQLLDYTVKLSAQRDQGSLTVIEFRRVVITIFMVVEVTLKRVNNKAVCPITWFQTWNENRKTKTTDKDLLCRNIESKRGLTPEECSKEVHVVRSNAGIDKNHSVTTIRKVAISAMQNKDKTKIEIDRWSRHCESADTVRVNYDDNNNDIIRKALSECVSVREVGEVNELRE